MATTQCNKSESGEHEADFERLVYVRHVGASSAEVRTACLHCDVPATFTLDNQEADWDDD